MKKIIIFSTLLLLVGCGCEKEKIIKEKSVIIIDVGTPSDAYITMNPIEDTIVELDVGKKFKLLKTELGQKTNNSIVISDKKIIEYKKGEIVAKDRGQSLVYFVSKDKKTKSNVLKIVVK